jgi:hypothetical protein
MKVEGIKMHTVKHMWEAYAQKLILDSNGKYFGVKDYKINNYYIFKVDTPYRSVRIKYPSGTSTQRIYERSGLVIDYAQFREIIELYFDKARREIIRGSAVLINGVGRIYIKRIERDFRRKNNKPIDWSKTAKYLVVDEATGKKTYTKIIYRTSDDYCRINWRKTALVNQSVYEFVPSHGSKTSVSGFKTEMAKALTEDKLLKYQYAFEPIKYNNLKLVPNGI